MGSHCRLPWSPNVRIQFYLFIRWHKLTSIIPDHLFSHAFCCLLVTLGFAYSMTDTSAFQTCLRQFRQASFCSSSFNYSLELEVRTFTSRKFPHALICRFRKCGTRGGHEFYRQKLFRSFCKLRIDRFLDVVDLPGLASLCHLSSYIGIWS